MSYPYTITVGVTDYTLKVPWETLSLEMTGTAEQCVAEFTIVDTNNSVSIGDGATVTIDDNLEGLRNFTGLVTTVTPRIVGIGRELTIRAVDLGSLLDIRLVPFDERTGETDAERLTYLMQTYGAGLSTDYSQIATTSTGDLPVQAFTNMTLRAAIETVCSIASTTTRYWVDAYGRLCTASSFTSAAPYEIVTRPDPPSGTFAPEDLAITRDSSGICNAYYVRGKTEAGSGWVTDADSITSYGRRAQYVDAPDADTGTKRDAVGNAYLSDTKDPIYRGTFSTYSPYDGWRPCQMVTVTSPQIGQDSAAFRILRVSKTWTNGEGARHYECEFGGTGFRFSLLSGQLMPSPQALLGGTVTGAFGGTNGVSLPSNAGVYATKQGIAVTDGTRERVRMGILSPGVYGLGLYDEFQQTLLDPSGFGPAWADYINSGIRNNTFASGAAGTLTLGTGRDDATGRTSALPFWTLWRHTGAGTATLVADSSWPGGHYVECAYSAVGTVSTNTVCMTSDLFPVLGSGFYYNPAILYQRLPVSGYCTVYSYILFYDAAGTYLSSVRFSAFATTAPDAAPVLDGGASLVPANARWGRLETISWTETDYTDTTFRVGGVSATPVPTDMHLTGFLTVDGSFTPTGIFRMNSVAPVSNEGWIGYDSANKVITIGDGTNALGPLQTLTMVAHSGQGGNNNLELFATGDPSAGDTWVVAAEVLTYTATNDASNYVSYQLSSRTAAGVAHNLGSAVTTASDTQATFCSHPITVNAQATAGDTHYYLLGSKTNSPTGLYAWCTIFYRKIAT